MGMICPDCNTVMIGGRIRTNASNLSFPSLQWFPESDFKAAGGWSALIFNRRKHKKAYLFDVQNEGWYCPTCHKIHAIFQAEP